MYTSGDLFANEKVPYQPAASIGSAGTHGGYAV